MSFHIGQEVVLVKDFSDSWRMKHPEIILPILNCIYTIREIHTVAITGSPKGAAFLLNEIINKPRNYKQTLTGQRMFGECGFYVYRFRPVQKTDISIFTAMLKPVKELV